MFEKVDEFRAECLEVIMQSLVRYSVLEVRKLLERDIMAVLQQQTEMLQRLLQDRPTIYEDDTYIYIHMKVFFNII